MIIFIMLMKFSVFFIKRKSKGYMAIKLEMGKAYDRFDCDFIRKCFIDLGFSDIWINWVMQSITTPFEVIVNGKIEHSF